MGDPNDLQPEAYGYQPDRPGSMGSIRTHPDPYANVRPAPSPARDDAEKAIAGLLAEHEWSPEHAEQSLTTAHSRHSYHFACAICQRDLDAIASVIAAHMAAPDELTALRAEVTELREAKSWAVEKGIKFRAERDALRERIRALAYGEPDIAVTADSPPPHTKYIDQDRLRAALGDA